MAQRFVVAQNEVLCAPFSSATYTHPDATEGVVADINDGLVARRAALHTHNLAYRSFVTAFDDVHVLRSAARVVVSLSESTSLSAEYLDGTQAELPITYVQQDHRITFERVNGTWKIALTERNLIARPSDATEPDADLEPFPHPRMPIDDERMGIPQPRVQSEWWRPPTFTINRDRIVEYVYKYVGKLNTFESTGYNAEYRVFAPLDCTNFISQALAYAGWPQKVDYALYDTRLAWFYNKTWPHKQSRSWINAHTWAQFTQWHGRATLASSVRDLQKGDILQIDFEGDGVKIDHSMVVTKRDASGNIWLTYHSKNTRDISFWDLDAAQKKTYPAIKYYRWRLKDSFN